jgi:hypothetical protein
VGSEEQAFYLVRYSFAYKANTVSQLMDDSGPIRSVAPWRGSSPTRAEANPLVAARCVCFAALGAAASEAYGAPNEVSRTSEFSDHAFPKAWPARYQVIDRLVQDQAPFYDFRVSVQRRCAAITFPE